MDFIESKKITQKISKTSNELLVDAIDSKETYPLRVYVKNVNKIKDVQTEIDNSEPLHKDLSYYQAEVIYHARYEKAKTVKDVLARRTRAAFLDIKASLAVAHIVVKLMAKELGKDRSWQNQQIEAFKEFAKNFDVNDLYR